MEVTGEKAVAVVTDRFQVSAHGIFTPPTFTFSLGIVKVGRCTGIGTGTGTLGTGTPRSGTGTGTGISGSGTGKPIGKVTGNPILETDGRSDFGTTRASATLESIIMDENVRTRTVKIIEKLLQPIVPVTQSQHLS